MLPRAANHPDDPPAADIRRYHANRQAEIDSATLYEALADAERAPALASVYRRLASTEREHAAFWEARLRAAGAPVPAATPSRRARTLRWLARRFGAGFVLPTLIEAEATDSQGYGRQRESAGTPLPAQEQSHGRVLRAIRSAGTGGMEGSALARLEGRHRAVGGNALRAAVLGANDGLVSTASLVLGVAAAEASRSAVLVAGVAGLVAGAMSMAAGEYVSVSSQADTERADLERERRELATMPEAELDELTGIYVERGLDPALARQVAEQLTAHDAHAAHARDELGITAALQARPVQAAWASALSFAAGAVLPLIVIALAPASLLSLLVALTSLVFLALLGAVAARAGGARMLVGAARVVFWGALAMGLTAAVGSLFGTSAG
jgi:VIT1/CCC1 family predicted Fe2+/Mn2+ transporter